jgi:hypothetical protein
VLTDRSALVLDRALGALEAAKTTRTVLEAAASEFDAAAALIGPEVREVATRGRSFWKRTSELCTLTLHQPIEYASRVQNGVDLLEAAGPGYDLILDSARGLGPEGSVGIRQSVDGLGALRNFASKWALGKDSPMPPNPRYVPGYSVAETPEELAAAARVYASAGQDVQMLGTGVDVTVREYSHWLSWDNHFRSEQKLRPVVREDLKVVDGSVPFAVYEDNYSGHSTTIHRLGDPRWEHRRAPALNTVEVLAAARPKAAIWADKIRQHGAKLEDAAQQTYESLDKLSRSQSLQERPSLPANLGPERVRALLKESASRLPEDVTRSIDGAFAAHRRFNESATP